MKIEKIYPEVVGAIGRLENQLIEAAIKAGQTRTAAETIFAQIPVPLSEVSCFFDKMTGHWRYEFGEPITLDGKLLWGTHMWLPVDKLWLTLSTAFVRLTPAELILYLKRLSEPKKHQEVLVEMRPVISLPATIPSAYEQLGYGRGNTTIDWIIEPNRTREVVIDVKRRLADLIQQFGQIPQGTIMPEPDHDPAILFRSIENKLLAADPDKRLQGAWVFTEIAQPETELQQAFEQLDPQKVHFVILGDWQDDALLLVKRESDRPFLVERFRLLPSSRFSFSKSNTVAQ